MVEKSFKNKYCFDTSALIDSWRRYYRLDTFRELWDRIGQQIKDGSILIPVEVKNEIGSGDDDLITWLKKYDPYVVPISKEQIKIVTEIVNKYNAVSQYKKPRPYHADPFVVAVGKVEDCIVVTYESKNSSKDNPAVPDLCEEFGIDCCSIADFFKKEGLQFNIK